MAFLLEGLIIGLLLGLALRPVLDAYVIHRMVVEAAREAGARRAHERPVPIKASKPSEHT
jgi:hypothetical protein